MAKSKMAASCEQYQRKATFVKRSETTFVSKANHKREHSEQ